MTSRHAFPGSSSTTSDGSSFAAAHTTQHKRKRSSQRTDDDEHRHGKRMRETRDLSDNGLDHGDGDTKDEATSTPKEARVVCDFCKNHPRGREMHRVKPCNWTNIGGKYTLECQNCADHRFSDDAHHVCCIGRKKHARQIYATQHPMDYPKNFVCENCKANSFGNTCDADPILGLSCTSCVTAKPLPADKAKHEAQREGSNPANQRWGDRNLYDCNICKVGNRIMASKPNLRQGYHKWFRHACDICKNRGKKKSDARCSWLDSRANWDKPCSRCKENKMLCMSSGEPVEKPSAPIPSEKWSTSHSLLSGWAECRGASPYRQGCMACLDGTTHHCRALAGEIEYSCAMCWEMGIVCWDTKNPHLGKSFPLFDFSRVGMGNLCTFSKCTRCKESGRNCDRQRPCDSCVTETMGEGSSSCCDGVRDGYNCIRRLEYPPGPIYYLALGYGARGVNDAKDGSKMEHWIGPPFPLYAIDKKPPTEAQKVAASQEKRKRMKQLTETFRQAKEASKRGGVDAAFVELVSEEGGVDDNNGDDNVVDDDEKKPETRAGRRTRRKSTAKSENKMTLTSIAQDMRRSLLPPCRPPLGTDPLPDIGGNSPGGDHLGFVVAGAVDGAGKRVQDKLICQLSAEELAAMVRAKWQGGAAGAYPPNRHPKYHEVVQQGQQAVRDLRAGKAPKCRARRRPEPSVKREAKGHDGQKGGGQVFDFGCGFGFDVDLGLGLGFPANDKWQDGFDGDHHDNYVKVPHDQIVLKSEDLNDGSQLILRQTPCQKSNRGLASAPRDAVASGQHHQDGLLPGYASSNSLVDNENDGQAGGQMGWHLRQDCTSIMAAHPSLSWSHSSWPPRQTTLGLDNFQLSGPYCTAPSELPAVVSTIHPLDMHPTMAMPGLAIDPGLLLGIQPSAGSFLDCPAMVPSSSQGPLPARWPQESGTEMVMQYGFRTTSSSVVSSDSSPQNNRDAEGGAVGRQASSYWLL